MARSGDDVCLMHPVLRVAQFDHIGIGREAMVVVNKFVYITPTAAAIKEVDVVEMKRYLSPPGPLMVDETPFWDVRGTPRMAYLEQRILMDLPMAPWSAQSVANGTWELAGAGGPVLDASIPCMWSFDR